MKIFRKSFAVLLLPFAVSPLPAQNGITISDFSTTVGTPSTVTFKVAWNKTVSGRDSAWVFADYNNAGTMTRLSLETGGHTSSAGTVTVSGNQQGVWLVTDTPTSGNFTSTISLRSAATYLAGACVYAVNYFPKGRYTSASTVVFNGTPKYDVVLKNAGSISKVESPYKIPDGDVLLSFTDATGAPGTISCLPPNPQTLVALPSYCEGASGVDISLANTQKGVIYELINEQSKAVVATRNGLDDGAGVLFGTYGAGSYSVRSKAEGAFCAIAVSGTHTVTEIATPATPGTSTPTSVCQGSNLTFVASGATNYNWEGAVTGDGNNKTAGISAGEYKARVRAYNLAGSTRCYGGWSGTVTGTIKPNPTISLTSGNNQTPKQGASISPIIFATNHASGATITSGSIPSGLSAGWSTPNYTISGTVNTGATAQNYTFTVTTSNANGCSNVQASGAITVQSIAATPSNAKTTTTWTVSGNGGAQVWSDVINVPACNKSSYSASNTTADCRNNGSYGYLYSWVYVNTNANTLCDNGWRVPTSTDFCNLDKNLNSSTSCTSHSSGALGSTYNGSAWGGSYGGYCNSSGSLYGQGSGALYWSSTEYSSTYGYDLYYNSSNVYPQDYTDKNVGFPVRCVK